MSDPISQPPWLPKDENPRNIFCAHTGFPVAVFADRRDADFARLACNTYRAIKNALNTEEDGDALVEVARNAHRAEQELAAAPDLLEALKIAREYVATTAETLKFATSDPAVKRLNDHLAQIDAALAKATPAARDGEEKV
jgi:hypothetical protein